MEKWHYSKRHSSYANYCFDWNMWLIKILVPFSSVSDYLLQNVFMIFQKKSVDSFDVVHKTQTFLVHGAFPPLMEEVRTNEVLFSDHVLFEIYFDVWDWINTLLIFDCQQTSFMRNVFISVWETSDKIDFISDLQSY